jgi:hypothetical protein
LNNKTKLLGIDKYGKPWYVFTKYRKRTVSFFVFSEEHSETPNEDEFIVEAIISKITKRRAIIEEFKHANYKQNIKKNIVPINYKKDNIFEKLCTYEPALEVELPEGNYGLSLSEALAGIEMDDDDNTPNWEDRGVGRLLLTRVEKWARRSHLRALFGFLSDVDDVEKLKRMYFNWGWQVRMFSSRPKLHCYEWSLGIVIKKL